MKIQSESDTFVDQKPVDVQAFVQIDFFCFCKE